MHSYSDPKRQAIVDDLYRTLCKNQQIIDAAKNRQKIRVSMPHKPKELTAEQAQRIAQNTGKVIYMGAHPKRTYNE